MLKSIVTAFLLLRVAEAGKFNLRYRGRLIGSLPVTSLKNRRARAEAGWADTVYVANLRHDAPYGGLVLLEAYRLRCVRAAGGGLSGECAVRWIWWPTKEQSAPESRWQKEHAWALLRITKPEGGGLIGVSF